MDFFMSGNRTENNLCRQLNYLSIDTKFKSKILLKACVQQGASSMFSIYSKIGLFTSFYLSPDHFAYWGLILQCHLDR